MIRWISAVALVIGLSAVLVARVAACSCAMTALPAAIGEADVAFVGTLQGTDQAAMPLPPVPFEEASWTWAVERSRDPIDTASISIIAWPDDGANCGVAFANEERWLVLGLLDESGRLATNGCMANHRMDGEDPETEASIEALLTETAEAGPPQAPGLEVPTPILVVFAGAIALALVSVVAFGRDRSAS
jgi:hypothetical protein